MAPRLPCAAYPEGGVFMLKQSISIVVLSLIGCAPMTLQVRMMPRDSGNVYVGYIVADRVNTATMDITIDGERYTGLWVKAATNETLGLMAQYGPRGTSSVSVAATGGGTRIDRGLFSSASGRGLRCESTATGMGGAGVCIYDRSRVFDITVNETSN